MAWSIDTSVQQSVQSFAVEAVYMGPCTGVSVPTRRDTITDTQARTHTIAAGLEEFSQYLVTVEVFIASANEMQSVSVVTLPTSQ